MTDFQPNRVLITPKKFNENSILGFLAKAKFIFNSEGKKEAGFTLNLKETQECSIIGVLLVYKFMEFAIKKNAFTTLVLRLVFQ
jgi:hypothetical protein